METSKMHTEHTQLDEIKLVGIKVITSLAEEMNPETSKIVPCLQQYFQQQVPDQIKDRKKPGVTYCAYTEYESDFQGKYTYFVGEEVNGADPVPAGLSILSVPAQKYMKFTTEAGPMPTVVIAAWQQIWQMTAKDFGGDRGYQADFEVYDQRAANPQETVLDIFVGIK
jgi:predicted transcriptional regulator YdeE